MSPSSKYQHPTTLGYMPLKSSYGFLTPQATTRDAAHELGHGKFNLRHTFSQHNVVYLPEGSTQNLMDYSTGSELLKYQWDFIHNPEGGWYLWEDSEEGASVDNTLFGNPVLFILNNSESKLYYCTSSGKDLPDNLLELAKQYTHYDFIAKKCSISDLSNGTVFYREINSTGNAFRRPTSEYQLLLDENLLTTISQERVDLEFSSSAHTIVLKRKGAGESSFKDIINIAVTEKQSDSIYQFEVVRTITTNQPRTDIYNPNAQIGNENDGDAIVESGEVITFKLLKGTDPDVNDFVAVSEVDWYMGDNPLASGESFVREIEDNKDRHIKAIYNNSEYNAYLNVREIYKYSNPNETRIYTVNVDALDDDDKQPGRNMYTTSLESIKSTNNPNVNLNNIINTAKIEVFLKKNSEMVSDEGITYDGNATTQISFQNNYDLLKLVNIERENGNIITNAVLGRGLTQFERQALVVSANKQHLNSLSEWLINRISQTPQGGESANTLRNRIINGESLSENYLNGLYNPVKPDEWWQYIRINSTGYMTIELNHCNLKDDIAKFRKILAHELLHLHWSFYRTPEKLLWMVIRDKSNEYGYNLADGLNENNHCSAGEGHERNNPEHEFVCTNQDNY